MSDDRDRPDDWQTPREVIADEKGIPIGDVPEDVGAADVLAAVTGEPKENFESDYDEYPMPDFDDLERVPAEEYHDDCDCLEGGDADAR